jgi:hypothetical protein
MCTQEATMKQELELAPSDFAEMVEHAAVRVRVVGKANARRMPLSELKALFHKELAAEIARRAPAPAPSFTGAQRATRPGGSVDAERGAR